MATIQIRDVPADVHETIRRRARAAGKSLQQYLLSELVDHARHPTVAEVMTDVDEDMTADPTGWNSDPDAVVQIIRADRDSR